MTSAHDMIMMYRPLSHMLKLAVLPNIDERVSSGTLASDKLPLQVTQFRIVMPPPPKGGKWTVELNDEAQVQVQVKTKRAIQAGDPIYLQDIDPEECFLNPPFVDGKPAAYYLYQSVFLHVMTLFDFTPNGPDADEFLKDGPLKSYYPIQEMVRAQELARAIRPVELYGRLAKQNWPPAPAYYPNILIRALNDPGCIGTPAFADAVAQAYGNGQLSTSVAFWRETDLFPGRIENIQHAVEEYLEGDWISSIHVIVPQFEGAVKDYVTGLSMTPKGFGDAVRQLKAAVLSRRVLLFPRGVLDIIFEFLETGTFLRHTSRIGSPDQEVNRHGIAHGVFKQFESRDIALKYLALFDALAFVFLHDRIVTGTL